MKELNYIWIPFLVMFLCSEMAEAQSLEQYLRIAAEENPEIRSSYSEFEAAMEEVPQVKSLPDPQLTMTAFGKMVETRLGPQEARFSLMQMFPWFGTLGAKAQAANLMAEAQFQTFIETRNLVLLKLSELYFDLFELEQQISFQEENVRIIGDYKNLALSRVSAGSGSLADVLQTEIRISENKTALEILHLKRASVAAAFNLLLNRSPEEPIKIPEEILKEIPPGTFSLENNPRIQEMEAMAEAYKARREVAVREGFPALGLGVDYVVIGKRMDMPVADNGRDAIMPMMSVSLPIFRKKVRAAKRQAELMARSYEQREEAVRIELKMEMENAIFELQEAGALSELYQRQVTSTEQVLQLMLSSYESSGSEFGEILEVQQDLLEHQFSLARSKAEYATAMARINYITGNISDNHENKEQE